MSIQICPYCKREFDTEFSPAMPFCSVRCRLADLDGWLNEEYTVPTDVEKELERLANGGEIIPNEKQNGDAASPTNDD